MAEQSVCDTADPAGGTVGIGTVRVTIRYFAAARAAAGVPEELLVVPITDPGQTFSAGTANAADTPPAVGTTVGDVLEAAIHCHGQGLARVLQRCSFLLDEVAVHGSQTSVGAGQVLDVLPPFAGG